MDDRFHFLLEYHMGHTPLEENVCKFCEEAHLSYRYSRDALTGEDAIAWAGAELNAGRTSDALLKLGSLPRPTLWRDAFELFHAAYADLGYDKFSREEHLRADRREIANRIIDGRMSPRNVCWHIWRVVEHLDFPSDIDAVDCDMLLASCDPVTKEIPDETSPDAKIIQYARTISREAVQQSEVPRGEL
jgi:hypothetical protein